MGYTTEFEGHFYVSPPLKPEHREYLQKFADTRRMDRIAADCMSMPDSFRERVGFPVGVAGKYFVGGGGYAGQDRDKSIVDYNQPPAGQPGLWCKWEPNKEGTAIQWSGAEKFYDYVEWIEYLIVHFMKRWGYELNGVVTWSGEYGDDYGEIVIINNEVTVVGSPGSQYESYKSKI